MRRITESWLARIRQPAARVSNANFLYSNFPVLPWITPHVHPDLMRLMENIGTPQTLAPDEPIFGIHENVDRFVLVKKGITARGLANPYNQAKRAIAVALPGHFGAGNLNYYSRRPAFGRYFAITHAEVIYCPHDTLEKVLQNAPELARLLAIQIELTALSDRIGFAALTLLDAEDRLRVFEIAWALNFGRIEPDGEWIRMPYACRHKTRAHQITTSEYWLDKQLKMWREQDVWRTEGEDELIRVDFLEPVYKWLQGAAEPADRGNAPATMRELLMLP